MGGSGRGIRPIQLDCVEANFAAPLGVVNRTGSLDSLPVQRRMGLERLHTIRRLDLHLAITCQRPPKLQTATTSSRPLQPALILSVQFITNGGMTHKHTPVSITVTCYSQTIRVSDPG